MGLVPHFFSRVFKSSSQRGYCAFCRGERKYPTKKHLHFFDGLNAMIFSAVLGAAIWERVDPRSLVLFAVFICVGEVFISLRWRQRMICRHCGFDPVLYNISPDRAREKVRLFYEERMNRPEFLLSKSPLLELRKELLEQERLKQKIQRVKERQRDLSSLPPSSL